MSVLTDKEEHDLADIICRIPIMAMIDAIKASAHMLSDEHQEDYAMSLIKTLKPICNKLDSGHGIHEDSLPYISKGREETKRS